MTRCPLIRLGALTAALSCCAVGAFAQVTLVTYSFTGNTANATSANASVVAGPMSTKDAIGISNGSPVSSGYSGSSGSYFASDNNWGSFGNYFQFTLTPTTNTSLDPTSFSFGYRMSSTDSPTGFALFSSADNYTSAIASGSLTNTDTSWRNSGSTSITLAAFTTATTFRLSTTGAGNNTATMRLDDLAVVGAVSAVPEPSTYAAIFGALALAGVVYQRRRAASRGGAS